ncbi:MAG TPA: retropepsin-like aspartic protease, partial [Gillisia sp.]|nr:retropepsin-like aspartic protease [Gillisia sp.]
MDSLITQKNYFAARDLYKQQYDNSSQFDRLKAGVFLDHAFNQSKSSAQKAEELFSHYEKQLTDSIKYKIEALAHINYSREYEYKKAYNSLKKLLLDYDHYITEAEKKNFENTLLIWKALQDQPKQNIIKDQTLEIPITRDKAGLQNLLDSSGNAERNFIFDTGANISTITESTAEEFGVELLDGSFEVNAITGDKIISRIGIAPEIKLGPVTIENAVFLVFPDEALAFEQIDFQINGILGFPILEALDEIHITKDDRFIVPLEQTTTKEQNLALDFLTPLLYLKNQNGAGVYTFDTGANKTMLYNIYLLQHQKEFDGDKEDVEYTFGGAGGVTSKKGFYTTFRPIINDRTIAIDSVIVLKEPVTDTNLFYG